MKEKKANKQNKPQHIYIVPGVGLKDFILENSLQREITLVKLFHFYQNT